jgi:hypothetical protein
MLKIDVDRTVADVEAAFRQMGKGEAEPSLVLQAKHADLGGHLMRYFLELEGTDYTFEDRIGALAAMVAGTIANLGDERSRESNIAAILFVRAFMSDIDQYRAAQAEAKAGKGPENDSLSFDVHRIDVGDA